MVELIDSYDFETTQWVWLLVCAMLIGMSKAGVAGIGILVVPVLANVFGARPSVGLLLPMLIFADIYASTYYRNHAEWKYVWRLIPWAFVGVLIGWQFGNYINEEQFSLVLGFLVIIGIVLMVWQDLRKGKIRISDTWYISALLGMASGFTSMVGNAAGAIMSLYLLSMRMPKNRFIGTIAWFFLFLNVFKLPFHIFSWETVNAQSFTLNIMCIVPIIIGGVSGTVIVKLIPEKAYRIFVIATTVIAAIFLI